ncbi:LOW QUALITY PROTEIN: NEDD4-binding protein 2-like 2 [Sarcophilus harrisii]
MIKYHPETDISNFGVNYVSSRSGFLNASFLDALQEVQPVDFLCLMSSSPGLNSNMITKILHEYPIKTTNFFTLQYDMIMSRNSSIQASRNDCNEQDEQDSNDFCETREESWEDPCFLQMKKTDRLINQQFQEEKLKRLLILLRGLPGSGKTTMSHVLLGQNCGGIVFSIDNYFWHQNGYLCNVTHLGDAHDWNQSRAEQKTIDQGRSPVIIDNTNTQAWQTKPYVEMAIGKGHQVEFHKPETWWKFDPEELEKKKVNKHGVSHEKIAQMLDHYEYNMSICFQ